jgi:surfeit locus 1 family protein
MKRPQKIARKRAPKKTAPTPPWRRLLWPGVFALIVFVVLCELGFWQLHRLAWKEDLIARVGTRTHLPAIPLPSESAWPAMDAENDEYRRVSVTGRYRYAQEVFAYALLSEPKGKLSGPGYWVMTPLVRADGSAIFVNRGFVPLDHTAFAAKDMARQDEQVSITGVLRFPEGRNWFTPADNTEKRIWQERNPSALAKAYGLARVAPFFIDADASGAGGLPQGGETRVSFPNNHLQYVITWFGLAFALLAVFFVFARREWRRGGRA